jgi:2-polyprenyl-3-methyl-5-hydroxy-6-metoxy-1,4-benzoquinol methylase
MEILEATILNQVEKTNPILAETLRKEFIYIVSEFPDLQKHLFEKLITFLKLQEKDLQYGVECLIRKSNDLFEERLKFLRTSQYSHNSFSEVNENVYNKPKVMEYHTIGLLMIEMLMSNNYKRMQFLVIILKRLMDNISSYLEIGGGHGMYLWQAEKVLKRNAVFDLVDISKTSIAMAKLFLDNLPVNYYHNDIFEFTSTAGYDFISMCEILEHMEKPASLLQKAKSLLHSRGHIFITTPINSPAIDHIYLFDSVKSVRSLLCNNGLNIIEEKCSTYYNLSVNESEKRKMPIDYFALVQCA